VFIVLGFFFKVYQHGYIQGGSGTRPKNFIKSEARPAPTGFCDFQPAPAKKGLKSARIGSARGGAARVGRIGRVLPTPTHAKERQIQTKLSIK
jgi:hypothetical protein